MEKKKCAIFSCLGLGDGLISLVLSNNLQMSGYSTLTFHPFLQQMQPWFPNLEIKTFPSKEEMEEMFKSFDHFYIFLKKVPG